MPIILIDIKTLDDCRSVPPGARVYLAMADNTWKIKRSGGTGTSGHFSHCLAYEIREIRESAADYKGRESFCDWTSDFRLGHGGHA